MRAPADELIASLVEYLGETNRPESLPESVPVVVNVRGAVKELPCVIVGYESNEEALPVRDSFRADVVVDLLTQFQDAPEDPGYGTSEDEHRAWSEGIGEALDALKRDAPPLGRVRIYAAFDRGVEHAPAERHAMTRRTWEVVYRVEG